MHLKSAIKSFGGLVAALLCWAPSVSGADQGSSVVIVYNPLMRGSKDVATHYALVRGVPQSQIKGLDLPTGEVMTRREYREELQRPLLDFLKERGLFIFEADPVTNGVPATGRRLRKAAFRYLVLCYGVPLRVAEDADLIEPEEERLIPQFRRNGAAVDSELSVLPLSYEKVMLAGPLRNPYFGTTNAAVFDPTNGVLIVSRLDGPSADVARALVDKSMQAEKDGLWGRAYFDCRGITNGPYEKGDASIAAAARFAQRYGYETIIDNKPETFPPGFPMSQIALYAGWYEGNACGPFAEAHVEFMPGAFAYHLHSFSAATLRSSKNNWCGPLLAEGAAGTMGCVDEPYLDGTPEIDVFFGRWLFLGFSLGEAAYASEMMLSWQTTVVGDPLYQPFKKNPELLHQELISQNSKLVEWSHLRWVDANLATGKFSNEEGVHYLEKQEITARSAVLTEKLADLYAAEGKTRACVSACERALKLDPTPEQKVRLTLDIGDRLTAEGKQGEALKLYQAFLKSAPNYPGAVDVYRIMETLAHHLGQESEASIYALQIRRLTLSP